MPEETTTTELTLEERKAQAVQDNYDAPQTFLVRDYQTMTIRELDQETARMNDAIALYDQRKAEAKARIDVLKAKRADIVAKITKDVV